jgi:prepilin-type N-terminal cleavage/methylation domain-containing protein
MNARHRSRRGGFTLIEMIITLSVFLLLAAAIFSIFGATLQGATTLQDDQSRSDQSDALGAWLRQSFLSLPAQGTLVSYHRDGRPFRVSGVIWGAGDQLSALDLQPQANGNYALRYSTYPADQGLTLTGLTGTASAGYSAVLMKFQTEVFNDDPSLNWRILVRDIKSADWRFRAPNAIDWVDVSSGAKPLFAELTFQLAGKADPVVEDFWIPPLQPPNSGTAAAPVAAPAAALP